MAKIIAPVVTIFNEEEKPDYAGNKKVIDFLIEGGLEAFLCWVPPENFRI